ncbi:hypothetical protein AB0N14_38560 [Streptomyces sp. NPDC051104]|uniref:hypothetical protein n=1 Tax=Streptomyces sp. NPDC051104 TaxID=3155044 RepID=UPI00341E93DF
MRTALPPTGAGRAQMGQGLRSLYRVLKARRLVFTDPARQVKTGFPDPTIPMPLAVEHIRAALDSADPARALLSALVAFHGLTAHQLQHLRLTHVHDGGHLNVDGRRVPLAEPVRLRLAAYLDHRNRHWPTTANPHLFLHFRSATTSAHVGHRWIILRLGPHLTCRPLRNDRLLDEALATDGDAKRLGDLFGISTNTARRYTQSLGHPGLQGLPEPGQAGSCPVACTPDPPGRSAVQQQDLDQGLGARLGQDGGGGGWRPLRGTRLWPGHRGSGPRVPGGSRLLMRSGLCWGCGRGMSRRCIVS